ncbi:NAD dependent epimerase/dehydratase family protein [Listeria grandensis FSL F6-0971]|uniref:NAD dependent epimerase/dehydratase family protein n=1 Tax=Listeria grandensis FSL F6-0971 TaxID=1265819 RepID=W7BKI3_9LIST|nr:NAD-dependent epimerase/dehydratase family protein [Listeria grandensis]EUJ23721.1 NAD dependent epimerase/dehydratase family protein [Listeria grandensis FSL F6-0971]
MSTVLITGGLGFIGSHLAHRIAAESKVVIVDNISTGRRENVQPHSDITVYEGDITDNEMLTYLFTTYEFDYIYHLAAIASVAESVERPHETLETNFKATVSLLEHARNQKHPVKRFVFASSAAVFGDEKTLPKTEFSPVKPLTPYAIDKLASEQYVLAYNALYGLNTSAVRFFNVYGMRQNPESPYSGVISILTKAFSTEEQGRFTVYGNGNQTRDFVFIKDVIDALVLIAHHEKSKGEVYNIGTGQETSLNELIGQYQDITGNTIETMYEEPRQGDIHASVAGIEKLRKLGFEPRYNVYEGLTAYWKNY